VRVVVKVGSGSLVEKDGTLKSGLIYSLAQQIKDLRKFHEVVLVSSGAIAAGLSALKKSRREVSDIKTLTAISSVGQVKLIQAWQSSFNSFGYELGQILLSPSDFIQRSQYLHARETLEELLKLGIVPVINENDAVCDDEIRFGDNDRLAALVASLLRADLLLLLTDTEGLYLKDPRFSDEKVLVKEVLEIDSLTAEATSKSSSDFGSGGMASKLAAAKIASWSGTDVVIAKADAKEVIVKAVKNFSSVGTYIKARKTHLSARLLWIAFASESKGVIYIDQGAKNALSKGNSSLLLAGVINTEGSFEKGDIAEIRHEKELLAKGILKLSSGELLKYKGKSKKDLPEDIDPEVVHRDDMVVFN